MISGKRAKEIKQKAAEFPFFGAYERFMTDREKKFLQKIWIQASDRNGTLSRAAVLDRIARGVDPITGARK